MANEQAGYTSEAHALFIEERKMLIDAARESARTFDQSVLAFGSAAFGFSITFLKDIAPHPWPYSVKWLALAWGLFAFGLLGIMLSFLFSQKACMFEIDVGAETLLNPKLPRPKNPWSTVNDCCNYSSVVLMFLGLLSCSIFAFQNLGNGATPVTTPPTKTEDRGYTPPRTPPPPPSPASPASTPPVSQQK